MNITNILLRVVDHHDAATAIRFVLKQRESLGRQGIFFANQLKPNLTSLQ